MQALQIDAINTVIRSHYMPVFSRLGHYDRTLLDTRLFEPRFQSPSQRQFFEYWGHECSLMPVTDFPLLQWRMQDAREQSGIYKQLAKLAASKPAFITSIKQSISETGPLTTRDLAGKKRGPGMWEWSENKQALEYLFCTGEVSTRGRRGFNRLYDLTENTIPARILKQCPSSISAHHRRDSQATLMEKGIAAHGIATLTDARDYYRLAAPDAASALEQLIEDKRIEEIHVEGWEKPGYCLPGLVVPRSVSPCTLLTPFDPLTWCRDRLKRLFDVDYRIEIYVPEHKRKYGYYVMPFLLGENIVARCDLKADRDQRVLNVLGAWPEPGQNPDEIAVPMRTALANLAAWLGLDAVDVQGSTDFDKSLHSTTSVSV